MKELEVEVEHQIEKEKFDEQIREANERMMQATEEKMQKQWEQKKRRVALFMDPRSVRLREGLSLQGPHIPSTIPPTSKNFTQSLSQKSLLFGLN